jgi:hypothetical protein
MGKAHEILASQEKWVKNAFAKRKDGSRCNVANHAAFCFCTLGAIYRAYPYSVDQEIYKLADLIVRQKGESFQFTYANECIVNWNDHPETTFAEVKKFLTELDI